VGVIAIALLVYLILRYRQKTAKQKASTSSSPEMDRKDHGCWHDAWTHPDHAQTQLSGKVVMDPVGGGFAPQEMEDVWRKHELPSTVEPQELPAGYR
jgi:hypothetical protein